MKFVKTKYKQLLNVWEKTPIIVRVLLFIALLTTPIILYCLPLLLTGNHLAVGDADYYMQLQEAARKSIFEYGQFPWWNPWVAGGVPLFANPQFGLISIPSIFTLIFGSIIGYKLALTFYLVMGFWGFYLLFRKIFRTPLLTTILLCYIWTFGSFFAYRVAGHYTFFIIQFFPFLLFLFMKRKEIKYSWLWLGLVLGLMINSAAHYATIMSMVVFGIFILVEIFKLTTSLIKQRFFSTTIGIDLRDIKFLFLSGVIMLIFAGQRIFYSLEYFREYPRSLPTMEPTTGIVKSIFAIFGPIRQYSNVPSIPNWSWMEISAYIGIMTGVAAIVCFILFIRKRDFFKARIGKISPFLILVLALLFFILGLGTFAGDLSPYNLLRQLPVFSGMRVATRWLLWSSMMTLLFISLYNKSKYRIIINGLLFISVIELFAFGSPFMAKNYVTTYKKYPTNSTINQQIQFDNKRDGVPYDENLTATTQSNIGQVVAGDSLIDTRQIPGAYSGNTIRCDSDIKDCNFVMTNNANVTYWSPNAITLKRTAPGDISLNMNPGKYWLVNGHYTFTTMRLAEPDKKFIITDKSSIIKIKLQPKFSYDWFIWKLTGNY